jgi:hypothetical protein
MLPSNTDTMIRLLVNGVQRELQLDGHRSLL